MPKKFLSLLFSIFFAANSVKAGFEYTASSSLIMERILDLRFKEAAELIKAEKKKNPGNKLVHLFENYIDFLTNTIGEEREYYFSSHKLESVRLAAIAGDPQIDSPWYLHCQAEIELQWAFSGLKFGEHLTAAKEINRAYKKLTENLRKHPDFLPSVKSMGLLKCLIGSMPDKYTWIKELKGLNGSVKEGTSDLFRAMNAGKSDPQFYWITTESLFYLSFISMNLYQDPHLSDSLILQQKQLGYLSPLIVYASSSLLIRNGKSAEAYEILKKRQFAEKTFSFQYLNYLHGLCLLYQGDTTCRKYFKEFLVGFKGRTFIRSAWNKLAWSYLIQGDSVNYRINMGKVKISGTNIVDEDKQATIETERTFLPNQVILRSRLFFDGGYYSRALKELTSITPSRDLHSAAEQLEAIYRLARIHHKMGNMGDAINSYLLTLVMGEKTRGNYYAPNAALQLGLIAEEKGDKEGAKKYYKKCLSYADHEYKQSLDQKAQAGLSRLK